MTTKPQLQTGDLKEIAAAAAETGPVDEDATMIRTVLKKRPEWKTYFDSGLISLQEKGMLLDFETQESPEDQANYLEEKKTAFSAVLVKTLSKVHVKEATQYLLAVADQLLSTNTRQRAPFFNDLAADEKEKVNPYAPFLRVLTSSDDAFSVNRATHVLGLLFSVSEQLGAPCVEFVRNLVQRLSKARGRELVMVLSSVKDALKNESIRPLFIKEGGLKSFAPLLRMTEPSNVQVIYLVGFCCWLVSFTKSLHGELKAIELIPRAADILKTQSREKVIRIYTQIFVNLLDDLSFNEQMITSGIYRSLDSLMSRKFKDDDLNKDLEEIKKVLEESVVVLSSFDKYVAEVSSGALDWTPVHSEQFWRENNAKFEEKSYVLIKHLVDLLASANETTVEVACYDLGEFARFHPDGKRIITSMNGKKELMSKLTGKASPKIARQALLAVQKLMVSNWENLNLTKKLDQT